MRKPSRREIVAGGALIALGGCAKTDLVTHSDMRDQGLEQTINQYDGKTFRTDQEIDFHYDPAGPLPEAIRLVGQEHTDLNPLPLAKPDKKALPRDGRAPEDVSFYTANTSGVMIKNKPFSPYAGMGTNENHDPSYQLHAVMPNGASDLVSKWSVLHTPSHFGHGINKIAVAQCGNYTPFLFGRVKSDMKVDGKGRDFARRQYDLAVALVKNDDIEVAKDKFKGQTTEVIDNDLLSRYAISTIAGSLISGAISGSALGGLLYAVFNTVSYAPDALHFQNKRYMQFKYIDDVTVRGKDCVQNNYTKWKETSKSQFDQLVLPVVEQTSSHKVHDASVFFSGPKDYRETNYGPTPIVGSVYKTENPNLEHPVYVTQLSQIVDGPADWRLVGALGQSALFGLLGRINTKEKTRVIKKNVGGGQEGGPGGLPVPPTPVYGGGQIGGVGGSVIPLR